MAKIDTYDKLLRELSNGNVRSASELRDLLKPYAIYRLELEEGLKIKFNELVAKMEAEEASGDLMHQKRKTLRTLKRVQSGMQAGGEGVNWEALNVAKKALGFKGTEYHLGHTHLSNIRLYISAIRENWKEAGKRPTFNDIMSKVGAMAQVLDKLDDAAVKKLSMIKATDKDLFANDSEAKVGKLIEWMNQGDAVEIKATNKQSYIASGSRNHRAFNLIGITIESAFLNKEKGKVSKAIANLINYYLGGAPSAKKHVEAVIDKIQVDIHSSPSLINDIETSITRVFLNGKAKNIRRRGTARLSRKIAPISVRHNKGTKVRKPKPSKRVADTGLTLLPLLNQILPDYVRSYMSDPSDAAVKLRNQTGRFSESVEAVGVASTRAGATTILYTFMRDPYGTFLPGGRLYTPERDPSGFIPLAIRDAARQIISSRMKIISELV